MVSRQLKQTSKTNKSGSHWQTFRAHHAIKNILCPVELSCNYDYALSYAVTLASALNAKLMLCHCVSSFACGSSGHLVRCLAELVQRHEHYRKDAELAWQCAIEQGEPAEVIVNEAYAIGADLIVMNSRRRPIAAALLGSTAEAVCSSAPCPILVVHPNEHEWINHSTGTIELKQILVAYDFSINADLSLRYAIAFAKRYHAVIHLLHVFPVGLENLWVPPTEEKEEQTLARLRMATPSQLQRAGLVCHELREGEPASTILSYACDYDIDLICIGAHGKAKGWLELFGTNADRVLREAPCPVLVARSSP
ncbi:MAG: universal stress protein [Acidobacteriota bacterium]